MNKYFGFCCLTVACGSLLLQDCKSPLAPNDIEAGIISVTAGCQFLTGLTENQTVISICATIEEIAFIASLFTPLLQQDGPPDADCTYLPQQTVCLTQRQIGDGIDKVVSRRMERLLRDASKD